MTQLLALWKNNPRRVKLSWKKLPWIFHCHPCESCNGWSLKQQMVFLLILKACPIANNPRNYLIQSMPISTFVTPHYKERLPVKKNSCSISHRVWMLISFKIKLQNSVLGQVWVNLPMPSCISQGKVFCPVFSKDVGFSLFHLSHLLFGLARDSPPRGGSIS